MHILLMVLGHKGMKRAAEPSTDDDIQRKMKTLQNAREGGKSRKKVPKALKRGGREVRRARGHERHEVVP